MPDSGRINDECQEICSEMPYPCFDKCFTEFFHEQNDTFWQCSGHSVCIEACETDYSSCISRCNKNNKWCAFNCLIDNGYCHGKCLK